MLSGVLFGILDGSRITRQPGYPHCLLSTEDSYTAREICEPEDGGYAVRADSPWWVWRDSRWGALRVLL